MEKLYELVEEGQFDLVVVDTPPTRNALDFLDAPRRLTHFLENRVFQALMKPPGPGSSSWGGGPGPAADHLTGGRSRDRPRCGELLPGFRGDGRGFRNRAARVKELLVDADTASCWWRRPGPIRSTRPSTSPASCRVGHG